MELYKSHSSNSVSSSQQQNFSFKPESSDHHNLPMLNNNNNNHLHLNTSSNPHFMNDLYMVKRHFNEVIPEHSPNHLNIPNHHIPSNNNHLSGKRLSDEMRCVKRTHDRNGHFASHVPTAVRRNERERNRVKMVNLGFSTLRQHVPNGAKNKKMSKVETLRSAVDYIKQLQKVLGEGSLDVSSTTSSGSSSLGDCYNTSSGMDANSCSPMSSSCSPRPSMVDGVHSSPDVREDRGGDGNVSFSDSDHHRYSSSHDDDMIMDSLKWY